MAASTELCISRRIPPSWSGSSTNSPKRWSATTPASDTATTPPPTSAIASPHRDHRPPSHRSDRRVRCIASRPLSHRGHDRADPIRASPPNSRASATPLTVVDRFRPEPSLNKSTAAHGLPDLDHQARLDLESPLVRYGIDFMAGCATPSRMMASPRKSRNRRTAGINPRRDGNTAWNMPCRGAQPGNTGTSNWSRISSLHI